jgi:hypothetical protein
MLNLLEPTPTPAAPVEAGTGMLGLLTFPALIHDICEARQTVVLTARDGGVEKTLYIDGGQITFAGSNDKEDRLGSLLLKRGMVSMREMESAAQQARETGKRLGGVLVDRHLIRPQDLVWGVREQVKEIAISLFRWTRGSYQVALNPAPSTEVITLKMATGDVILEGIKRTEHWTRIQAAVGGMETRYRVGPRVEEMGRSMNLTLEEWTLLSRCEGPIGLGDLCDASPLKDFEVCRLVWAFTVVGLLVRLD